MRSFITQITPSRSLLEQAVRFTRLASQWRGSSSEWWRLRTGWGPHCVTDSLTEIDKMSTYWQRISRSLKGKENNTKKKHLNTACATQMSKLCYKQVSPLLCQVSLILCLSLHNNISVPKKMIKAGDRRGDTEVNGQEHSVMLVGVGH